MSETETRTVESDGMIICHIDGQRTHSVALHIKQHHADTWTLERYKEEFPDAPLLSQFAIERIEKMKAQKAQETKIAAASQAANPASEGAKTMTAKMAMFHEVFDLGAAPAARNSSGNPISIPVMENHDETDFAYLEQIDPNYVFNIDILKKIQVGFALNLPIYLWGYHGTGKTTILQQACARTKRPIVRVQHTINMQESEILGQWTVKDGQTVFQLGPLPMAMIKGYVYCADEYDYGMPNVLAVYQPVLEGQPLIIKDAPPHLRKIIPSEHFRFVATGNTNGVGDETGLYQGTLVQNAANYSRFGVTEEVKYMEPKIETDILVSRVGIARKDAERIVKFANQIRTEFMEGRIGMTISPREMISGAKIAVAYGGKWDIGLQLAYANRLSRVDAKVVEGFMQRIFA